MPNVAGIGNILDFEPELGWQLGEPDDIGRRLQKPGELALEIIICGYQIEDGLGRFTSRS